MTDAQRLRETVSGERREHARKAGGLKRRLMIGYNIRLYIGMTSTLWWKLTFTDVLPEPMRGEQLEHVHLWIHQGDQQLLWKGEHFQCPFVFARNMKKILHRCLRCRPWHSSLCWQRSLCVSCLPSEDASLLHLRARWDFWRAASSRRAKWSGDASRTIYSISRSFFCLSACLVVDSTCAAGGGYPEKGRRVLENGVASSAFAPRCAAARKRWADLLPK